MKQLLLFFSLMLLTSCQLPEDTREFIMGDFTSPKFKSGIMISPNSAQLQFTKEAHADAQDISISGDHTISTVSTVGETITIILDTPIPPGEYRILQGSFRDTLYNTLHLSIPIYGFNPNLAGVVVNEFTTKGSANHPDRVELLVTRSGCTGGIVMYDGIRGDYRQKKVLPAIDVRAGDFIIIHCRPGDDPPDDETIHTHTAQGPGTYDGAWDLFIHGGIGLSSNNGVITIYDSPVGTLMDGVFYSNRTSDSDDRYRGFGSTSMLLQVEYLCRKGVWDVCPSGVTPQDGISSAYSTATRSMSRLPGKYTGSRNDWITVPTRGATFGFENGTAAYQD